MVFVCAWACVGATLMDMSLRRQSLNMRTHMPNKRSSFNRKPIKQHIQYHLCKEEKKVCVLLLLLSTEPCLNERNMFAVSHVQLLYTYALFFVSLVLTLSFERYKSDNKKKHCIFTTVSWDRLCMLYICLKPFLCHTRTQMQPLYPYTWKHMKWSGAAAVVVASAALVRIPCTNICLVAFRTHS